MPIVNGDDLEWTTVGDGEDALRRTKLAEPAGGEALGCSLYELPAGGKSWPYHYHTGNEEAMYVLDGACSLRLDGELVSLEAGDYVALPADERGAHRVVNDSDGPVRYLAMSTMAEPDVTVYPDSEKIGVFAGSPPGGSGERSVHGYYRIDDDVDYWEGEE
ncbi:cupin domain-containing protein [Haloarchaeobius litoreus]|uniref:Cupin domain-containing protein n=1 Tax=Haloarchaeobius litoreus TaxID=755306 RepID=A0ABD6DDV8_9EURY|nr:cupin domain-containing protein [Haloarchaeobius litoreus]